jgi:hypothetical protein
VGLHSLHIDFGDLLLRLLDHCLEININDFNSKGISSWPFSALNNDNLNPNNMKNWN